MPGLALEIVRFLIVADILRGRFEDDALTEGLSVRYLSATVLWSLSLISLLLSGSKVWLSIIVFLAWLVRPVAYVFVSSANLVFRSFMFRACTFDRLLERWILILDLPFWPLCKRRRAIGRFPRDFNSEESGLWNSLCFVSRSTRLGSPDV